MQMLRCVEGHFLPVLCSVPDRQPPFRLPSKQRDDLRARPYSLRGLITTLNWSERCGCRFTGKKEPTSPALSKTRERVNSAYVI
jgi:hypothetical protein